jgi:excisionase family DNA binding protein
MSDQKPLLSAEDAAHFLGVSKYTLYGWTSAGKIPYRKAGHLLKFDESELKDWTRVEGKSSQKSLDQQG